MVLDIKPLKHKVSITLDIDIVNKVKELADDDDRSFSQYINLVLKDYIEEKNNNYEISNSTPNKNTKKD